MRKGEVIEPLNWESKEHLQILVKKHCPSWDNYSINDNGEVEFIEGTKWKWLAALIGKVERLEFMEVCFAIAKNIAGKDARLADEINQFLIGYVQGGNKDELIARFVVADLIGAINQSSGLNGEQVLNIPEGLWMLRVQTEDIVKGDFLNNPRMASYLHNTRNTR